jgi:hypothetical protein
MSRAFLKEHDVSLRIAYACWVSSLFLMVSAIHDAAASGSAKVSAAAHGDLVGAAMLPAKTLAAARKRLRVTFISDPLCLCPDLI